MKKILFSLIAITLVCHYSTNVQAQATYADISSYQVYFGSAKRFGQIWMVLRKFSNHGRRYLLLVNPKTLESRTDDADGYTVNAMTMPAARKYFGGSVYIKALGEAEAQSVSLQDAGIEHGIPKETGISLTADLCPSHRPLDRQIFTDIIAGFKKVETPVPIALSVSGLWMRHHLQDIAWLKQLQAGHEINITWINHSFNHRVSTKSPLKTNFLLEPGTDINYEVLETEKAMLANGLLPSVFFRFPGLVSDQQLVYKITNFGLIPIGTDAWLAKGQQPHSGSIVLIHGNGNEPVGVKDFVELLRSKAPSIANKQWLLYDLRQIVEDDTGVQ
ncbi:polysaccharide deacetylase [Mucilaginibacter sp.]|uniref:polysaccharide deacetylase family protein n=1 Tax=Mucilaginibacter sp. TaxID=1882438 RepID=UPI0035BC0C8F